MIKLGDKTWAKKLLEELWEKIEDFKIARKEKNLKTEFKDWFREKFSEKKVVEFEDISWDKIKVRKRDDWKYEIEWDSNIYTQKQVIEKIPEQAKRNFLVQEVKDKIGGLKPWEAIKIWSKILWRDWSKKYKIAQNEIIIYEKWKPAKKLDAGGTEKFYKENMETLLKKIKWLDIKKDMPSIIEKNQS